MTSSTLKDIERDARKIGVIKVYNKYSIHWEIECSKCGLSFKVSWGPTMPPDAMLKLMRQKHWECDWNKSPVCPSCTSLKKDRKDFMTSASVPVIESNVPSTQGPSAKITRIVSSLLEDYFDDTIKRYKPNWDDSRVAKEAGTSVPVVVKFREEAFGKLAEDPKVTELRNDIGKLEKDFSDNAKVLSMEILELKKRLSSLEKK